MAQLPVVGSLLKKSGMIEREYLRWDSPGVESPPPNEAEDIAKTIELVNQTQLNFYDQHRHCWTGTHARTQGIVKGTLTTEPNLPDHLKQSMFAEERSWPILCRYSTEPSDVGWNDTWPQPRGFAMKVFDVHGDMYEKGQDIPTQDIEFNSTPALDLADAKTAKEIFDLRLQHGFDTPEIHKEFKKRSDCPLQEARYQVYNTHIESLRFYSQSAYRFGDYVIKYSIVPDTSTQSALHKEEIQQDKHESNVVSTWLQKFFQENEADYLFQVQLLEDLKDQPVEYAGAEWDESKYPWQTVARLHFPKQDSFIYTLKNFWEDRLRLDPWMGLKSLQPLGSANRLRREVYPASSALRRKINSTTVVDIKSLDELPAH